MKPDRGIGHTLVLYQVLFLKMSFSVGIPAVYSLYRLLMSWVNKANCHDLVYRISYERLISSANTLIIEYAHEADTGNIQR